MPNKPIGYDAYQESNQPPTLDEYLATLNDDQLRELAKRAYEKLEATGNSKGIIPQLDKPITFGRWQDPTRNSAVTDGTTISDDQKKTNRARLMDSSLRSAACAEKLRWEVI